MITLAKLRARVQVEIRDDDNRKDSFGVVEIDNTICNAYLAMHARMGEPSLYTASGVTIAAGANTFSLPTTTTAEYAGDIALQLLSVGTFLTKCSVEEIQAWQDGQPTPLLSIPTKFALYEDSSIIVQGIVYPGAKVAEPCNLYRALVVVDPRDAADMDAVNIVAGRYAQTALIYRAAAMLAMKMSARQLETRDLNPQIAAAWMKDSDQALYLDTARRHDLEGVGRTQRWVS